MSRVLPILFNTDMVRAILDGRKTVTRRCVKPQPSKDMIHKLGYCIDGDKKDIGKFGFGSNECGGNMLFVKPPCQPGDYMYIRETWKCWRAHRYEATADIMFRAGGDGVRLQFANGNTDSVNRCDYDTFVNKWFSHNGEWKPSLFMPKEAARIFLKVKDVRVERLQQITEEQAQAEGCNSGMLTGTCTARGQFENLWNSTIKKSDLSLYGWEASPWVWVIEFERCEKPEEW